MSAEENKRLLEAALLPLAVRDARAFRDVLADDVVWTVQGTTRWSGTYRGKEALFRDLFRPFHALLEQPYQMLTRRIVAEDDLVVLELAGVNVTRAGVPYENQFCYVCRLRDGKICEVTEYLDTALVAAIAP